MRKLMLYSALFLFAFLPPIKGAAQWNPELYAAAVIPPSLLEEAHDVVRKEVLEFQVKNEREGRMYHRKIVTLLKPDSDANVLVAYYNKDTRVERMSARLYDANGQLIRKMERDEITDNAAVSNFSLYEDDRYKYVQLNHSVYPYTVEFELELSMRGIQFAVFPDWNIQEYHSAIQQAQFTIDLPVEARFYHRALNIALEPVQAAPGAGRVSYTWAVRDLPAIAKERFCPPSVDVLPKIITAPHTFQIDQYKGSMASWAEYGAFMYRLFEGRDVLPAEIAAEVRRIAAAAPDVPARIAALYRYMQGKMRYVSVQLGIGGWQPFDARYVSANGYGDCKALTNFMKAILKEVGIEAWPTLIRSGSTDYAIMEDFVAPRFNHVILYVPEADTWLECTSSDFPPNYIGQSNADRYVLFITPQGGKLARTPAMPAEVNLTAGYTEIRLQAGGEAVLAHQEHIIGEPHEVVRYMITQTAKDREDWLRDITSLPACNLTAFTQTAAAATPEADIAYQADAPRYASRTGKRMFVPINVVNPLKGAPTRSAKPRRQPIALKNAYTETDTIVIFIPEGFGVESWMEKPVTIEKSFGSYQLSMERQADRLVICRRLQFRPARLPATEFDDFRSFYTDVNRYDGQKVVFIQP